jgi:hypothetical protein
MLVQASNYYISAGGKIAEYITAGKKVTYSIHGNNPKIKPKENYFPTTKQVVNMSSGLKIATNYLKCLPFVYGYQTGGMDITDVSMTPFVNSNMNIMTDTLNISYPYGNGFTIGNLPVEQSALLNMDSNLSHDFSYINI